MCIGKGPLYFYRPPTMTGEFKPVEIDPNDFNPRAGIVTRYGLKLLEEGGKYYSKINLKEWNDESESKENSGGSNNPSVSD
jgi:hypothetical protein